jgi:superfamily I DNA/RNA helicase
MHVVENPTGRLVTFRINPPVSDENSARASSDLRALIVASERPVIVVSDMSAARAFAPETTAGFVALMKSDNPKIERSALLLSPDSATLELQIHRMLNEAAHPARRAFTDVAELSTWLHPLLTTDEKEALAAFLGGAARHS